MSELWTHQERGLSEISAAIDRGARDICLTSPTGGGKSRIIFELIHGASGDVSLYTDRRMLLRQIADGLDSESNATDPTMSSFSFSTPSLMKNLSLSGCLRPDYILAGALTPSSVNVFLRT